MAGESGTVVEVELFTTKLDTPDNRRIIIPNSSIFGTTIQNVTFHDKRRVDINVGTTYESSIDDARKVIETTIKAIPNTLSDPPPQVLLLSLGNSSIDWVARVWCKTKDYWAVKDATTRAIKVALDEANIGIPFPQMDIHFSAESVEKGIVTKSGVDAPAPATQ